MGQNTAAKMRQNAKVLALRPSHPAEAGMALPPLAGLLESQLDAMYRVALRLVGPGEVEDVLQQTCANALAGYGSLRDGRAARAWLFRVLHNTAYSMLRKTRKPIDVPVTQVLDDLVSRGLAEPPEPADELLAAREGREQLEAALSRLPRSFCEVIWLVDAEGFTLAEVAAILEIPGGTAASRLYRARRDLRLLLAGLTAEDDHARR